MIQFICGLMAGAVAVSLMHWAAECYIEKRHLLLSTKRQRDF